LKIQGEIIFIEMFVFKANWKANIVPATYLASFLNLAYI